ncbi:hypothetical protein [Methylopila sp. M107]|uniref:hypothetical protein n=1 Tax=Methylopila sp. M107 TaxID=1101190 RepID=UPI00037D1A39|nr:hypothetical protein [Methylopila sp. M107]
MGYTTVTKKLTPAIIAQAERLVRDGAHTPNEEWREPRSGFAIRFNLRGAIYLLRAVKANPKLGEVGQMPGYVARHLASELKLAMRSGRDHKAYQRIYLERIEAGDDPDAAHLSALKASGKRGTVSTTQSWTVTELSRSFVEYKVKNDLKEGRWARRFRRLFDDPAFDQIRNKKVRDVTHADLFAIRRSLVPSGEKGDSRAVVLIRYMVAMFDHGLQNEADFCGLLGRDPVWRAVTVRVDNNPRLRSPEPVELARLLLAVELHAARHDGVVVASKTLQTLLRFVFFTAQRDGAAARLRRDQLIEYKGRPDWRIAHFDAQLMKGRKNKTRAHAVPVPPNLVVAIEDMWAEVDPKADSEFVFPGHRGKGPIAATGLNALFRMLRGHADDRRPEPRKHYQGKPGPKPRPPRERKPVDLLEVYLRELKTHPEQPTDFTPHDTRRSLTDFLSELELSGASTAILGHAQATPSHKKFVEESAEQQMGRTTSRWYSTSQQISLKTRGIELWAEALERALAEQRPRVQEIERHIL